MLYRVLAIGCISIADANGRFPVIGLIIRPYSQDSNGSDALAASACDTGALNVQADCAEKLIKQSEVIPIGKLSSLYKMNSTRTQSRCWPDLFVRIPEILRKPN